MAMKETKTITVRGEKEDEIRAIYESFGWELESKSGSNDVKMTFRRDPERKNYTELKTLEDKYYAPIPPFTFTPFTLEPPRELYLEKDDGFFGITKAWLIAIGVLLLPMILLFIAPIMEIPMVFRLICLFASIGIIVWRVVGSSRVSNRNSEKSAAHGKAVREYKEAEAAHKNAEAATKTAHEEPYKKDRADALERAKSLV
jgi:hypothetical protein